MKRAICLLTLAVLLSLLFNACQVVQPLAAPRAASAERTSVVLDPEFRDLIWCWDSPDGKMPPTAGEKRVTLADFRPRFDTFCADTGIVAPDEPPLALTGKVYCPAVELTVGSRPWKRILEMNGVFGGFSPQRTVLDLLVLEVPGDLARRWGLDGLPAAGKPPARFADGIPSLLGEEEFIALRSAILKRRGSRIFATASMVTSSSETTTARGGNEMLPLTAVSLNTVAHITEPEAKENSEETGARVVDRAVPTVAYDTDDLRPLGVTLRGHVSPSPDDDGLCTVEAEIDIGGVDSWTIHNAEEHVRTPLISSFSLVTRVECRVGQTALVARAFQTGEACTALNGKPPRRSCLLAFVTPRWLRVPVRRPVPEDYVSPTGQLLVKAVMARELGLYRYEKGGIDSDGDDDGDDAPSWEKGSRTQNVRDFFAEFGGTCSSGTKIFYTGSSLVFFGSPKEVRRMQDLLGGPGSCPRLTISRLAAIRITPELWLELTADRQKQYGESDRILSREEARRFLRRVAQDRESEILSATAVLGMGGEMAILRDVVELQAPVGWERHLLADRSLWLPKWDDSRNVGSTHRTLPTLYHDGRHMTLEVEPEYTEFVSWQPCGPALGLPQYRSHRLNSSLVLERSTYVLLGGAGAGTDENPLVVWLVGVDGVGW